MRAVETREQTSEGQPALQAQLEAAVRELERLSYAISHDLKAPLRAIESFAAILMEDYASQLDEEGRRCVEIIVTSSRQLSQQINALLAFSRISRQELKTTELDMQAIACAVVAQVQRAAPREIEFRIAPLPRAFGDPELIRVVWTNLLENAVKFSSGTEKPLIEVSGRPDGAQSVYAVKDNGAGFDMRYADKLFVMFQRLHGSEFPGLGAGLAIAQKILQRHGGWIRAEGKMDEGAVFSFALPAGVRAAESI